MCSNAELQEILIILHICLFLTSYDSSNSRLGEMETIVTSNQSRELYCNLSLGKFDFYLNYSSHNLYIGLHSQSVRIRWWLMKHSQGILMLEVTQPVLCFWVNLVFVSSPTITSRLRPALILVWRSAMREMFNFWFLGNVYLVLTKFSFWPGD